MLGALGAMRGVVVVVVALGAVVVVVERGAVVVVVGLGSVVVVVDDVGGRVVVVVAVVAGVVVLVDELDAIVIVTLGDGGLWFPAVSTVTAKNECAPAGNDNVVATQCPLLSAVAPARSLSPSMTRTGDCGFADPVSRSDVAVVVLSPCGAVSELGSSAGVDGAAGAVVSTENAYGVTAFAVFGFNSRPVS